MQTRKMMLQVNIQTIVIYLTHEFENLSASSIDIRIEYVPANPVCKNKITRNIPMPDVKSGGVVFLYYTDTDTVLILKNSHFSSKIKTVQQIRIQRFLMRIIER